MTVVTPAQIARFLPDFPVDSYQPLGHTTHPSYSSSSSSSDGATSDEQGIDPLDQYFTGVDVTGAFQDELQALLPYASVMSVDTDLAVAMDGGETQSQTRDQEQTQSQDHSTDTVERPSSSPSHNHATTTTTTSTTLPPVMSRIHSVHPDLGRVLSHIRHDCWPFYVEPWLQQSPPNHTTMSGTRLPHHPNNNNNNNHNNNVLNAEQQQQQQHEIGMIVQGVLQQHLQQQPPPQQQPPQQQHHPHLFPQFAGGPITAHAPLGAPLALPAHINMNINAFVHGPGVPQEPPAQAPGLGQGQAQVQANGEIHINGVNIHPGGMNVHVVDGGGLLGSMGLRGQPFVPSVVRSLLGLKIVQIACGGQHAAVLTEQGAVYTYGKGAYGRLGHGDTLTLTTPKRVSALEGVFITTVALGFGFSCAVSREGALYAWGANDNGDSSLFSNTYWIISFVFFLHLFTVLLSLAIASSPHPLFNFS